MKRVAMVSIAAVALAGAAQPENPVERVADALWRGAVAEQAGDGEGLAEAARTLELQGARPDDPAGDAAKRWRAIAVAKGIASDPEIYRGRALGPAYRRGTLAPRDALVTAQVFLAGQKAIVAVVPQRGQALAMQISEAGGQEICRRDIVEPRETCSWLPLFTRRVDIRLANPGDRPVDYYLVSN